MTFMSLIQGERAREFLDHFEELPDGSWRVSKPFALSFYPYLDTSGMPEGRILDEHSDVSGFLNALYLKALKRSVVECEPCPAPAT